MSLETCIQEPFIPLYVVHHDIAHREQAVEQYNVVGHSLGEEGLDVGWVIENKWWLEIKGFFTSKGQLFNILMNRIIKYLKGEKY